MPVSITDVAKAAGFSIATVSRVLNGIDYPLAEETRLRVLEVAKEMGYRPNLIARSLRMEQTHTVGIIVENILSPFIPPIIRGIHDRLKQVDYLSMTLNADFDLAAEADAIERLGMRQIDGIIFVESYIRTSSEVSALINKPHLFVHRLFDSLDINSIVPDDRYGARLAVEHLVKLGHRRIAFINGPDEWDATVNRLAGYRDALLASGIEYDSSLVVQGDWQVQSGYQQAQQLLALPDRPSALFAANDLMALGVIYAAQEVGLSVPDDLALVGYDDRDFTGFVRPALTTIQMPCEKMGQIAADSLLRLIRGEFESIEPTLVQGELVVRQSCGMLRGGWEFEPEKSSLTRRIAKGKAPSL
jgi:LacI family transcriptional regulator